MEHRPYDLLVVRRSEVNSASEYYTISATGVMRIRKGEQSEFLALPDWIREKMLFSLLRSIPFFKTFPMAKTFRAWKSYVRKKLFNRVRSKVEERLFLARSTFVPSIASILGVISELQTFPMVGAQPSHQEDKAKAGDGMGGLVDESLGGGKERMPSAKEKLEQYEKAMTVHREQVLKPKLEELVGRIQVALEQVCKEAQKQAKLYQESIRDLAELEDTTGVDLYGSAGEKNRSMTAIRQDKIDRAKAYMRAMEEAARLGDFVRLIDYVLVEAMVSRVLSSVDEVLQVLLAPRMNPTDGIKAPFQTQIFFSDIHGGIEFSPSQDHVVDVVRGNIEGIISAVQSAPRVLHMRQFGQFFDTKLNGLNPNRVIRDTPHFQETFDSILGAIRLDFSESAAYAQQFERYRPAWDFGRSFSIREYESHAPQLDKLKLDMSQLRDWRLELDKMKTTNQIGMLTIESKTLRELIKPMTAKHLDSLKVMLLDRARDDNLRCLQALQQRIQQLSQHPADLDAFVSFHVLHTEMLEQQAQLIEDASQVDEMYDQLQQYEQKVPIKDEVKYSDLKEARALFLSHLDQAKEFILEHTQHQMLALDKRVHEINEKAMEILSSMHSGRCMSEESVAVEVVMELEDKLRGVQILRQRAEQFQQYQRLFGAPADDFTNLKTTEKELTGRYNIWKTLQDLEDRRAKWLRDPVTALNVEVITPEIEQFASTTYKLVKQYKDDRVVYRLRDSIDSFKQLMPLIEELGNPAFKPRHWEAIFALIGESYDSDHAGDFSIDVRCLDLCPRTEAAPLTLPFWPLLSLSLCRSTCWTGASSSRWTRYSPSLPTPARSTRWRRPWRRWRRTGTASSSASWTTRTRAPTSLAASTRCRPSWTTRSSRSSRCAPRPSSSPSRPWRPPGTTCSTHCRTSWTTGCSARAPGSTWSPSSRRRTS